jgi:hypothetical protein
MKDKDMLPLQPHLAWKGLLALINTNIFFLILITFLTHFLARLVNVKIKWNQQLLNHIIVEWMTEFQPAARIATWRPWNKQVVSEVTSW